ncbi:hypothetical protein Goklo_026253 [Gossypium klotzschianum]|uniref:DUF7745 domain-containing protein n=1 Tax=Gossypium klotzschianum TaxID=34286 RepID=A0A7J8TU64_9ROSI|nr:hypothetical protein [Gossypium klotzschianum]
MEKGFLDKVEDNATVRAWSKTTQHKKGDSLAERYVSELWDITRISVTQNSLDLSYLLDVKVDRHFFRALVQFWNPAYSCFTFRKVDLVPTIEEYMALLRCSKIQVDRVYSLVVFPKASGHVDEAVTDLFDRLDRRLYQSQRFWQKYSVDVEWKAPWLLSNEILYRCGDFDWVPLLGI